jgi:hypothetical protein
VNGTKEELSGKINEPLKKKKARSCSKSLRKKMIILDEKRKSQKTKKQKQQKKQKPDEPKRLLEPPKRLLEEPKRLLEEEAERGSEG